MRRAWGQQQTQHITAAAEYVLGKGKDSLGYTVCTFARGSLHNPFNLFFHRNAASIVVFRGCGRLRDRQSFISELLKIRFRKQIYRRRNLLTKMPTLPRLLACSSIAALVVAAAASAFMVAATAAITSAWPAAMSSSFPSSSSSSSSSFSAPILTRSWYVPMSDGVHLAVDLHTRAPLLSPNNATANSRRLPVILHFTKDVRSWRVRWPLSLLLGPVLNAHTGPISRDLTRAGFAVVSVDVRGSGASFGSRLCGAALPDESELDDLLQVLLWAVGQPWCDGNVGVYGVGYDGILAEFLTLVNHPSLNAAALLFSPYDVGDEVVMPGGVFNTAAADASADALAEPRFPWTALGGGAGGLSGVLHRSGWLEWVANMALRPHVPGTLHVVGRQGGQLSTKDRLARTIFRGAGIAAGGDGDGTALVGLSGARAILDRLADTRREHAVRVGPSSRSTLKQMLGSLFVDSDSDQDRAGIPFSNIAPGIVCRDPAASASGKGRFSSSSSSSRSSRGSRSAAASSDGGDDVDPRASARGQGRPRLPKPRGTMGGGKFILRSNQWNAALGNEAQMVLGLSDWPSWWPSPHLRWIEVADPDSEEPELTASILSIAGWRDGSTATATLRRHANLGAAASPRHAATIIPGARGDPQWQQFLRDSAVCFFLLRFPRENDAADLALPGSDGGQTRMCRPIVDYGQSMVSIGADTDGLGWSGDGQGEGTATPATMLGSDEGVEASQQQRSSDNGGGGGGGGGGDDDARDARGKGNRAGSGAKGNGLPSRYPATVSWFEMPLSLLDDTSVQTKGRTKLDLTAGGTLVRKSLRLPGRPVPPPNMATIAPREELPRYLRPRNQKDASPGESLWPRATFEGGNSDVENNINSAHTVRWNDDDDESMMTMASPPLDEPLYLLGHASVRLYMTAHPPRQPENGGKANSVTTRTKDIAVEVQLLDVAGEDDADTKTAPTAAVVANGQLRVAGRKAGVQFVPYEDFTPWRSFRERDVMPVRPGQMFVADVALSPTAHTFHVGHRVKLRIRASAFDRDPGWVYTIHVGGLGGSYLDLPGEPAEAPPQEDPDKIRAAIRKRRRRQQFEQEEVAGEDGGTVRQVQAQNQEDGQIEEQGARQERGKVLGEGLFRQGQGQGQEQKQQPGQEPEQRHTLGRGPPADATDLHRATNEARLATALEEEVEKEGGTRRVASGSAPAGRAGESVSNFAPGQKKGTTRRMADGAVSPMGRRRAGITGGGGGRDPRKKR